MGWSVYTHADINRRNPRPLGVCDKCGFVYNRDNLKPQYQWAGFKQMKTGMLVCRSCMDIPQKQLKTIILPADPVPIANPRPGEFAGMIISSSPDNLGGAFINQIVTEVYVPDPSDPLAGTTIGNRTPIVTQDSSLPLMPEITVTPNPDPEYQGTVGEAGRDGGYTRMPSSDGTMVST